MPHDDDSEYDEEDFEDFETGGNDEENCSENEKEKQDISKPSPNLVIHKTGTPPKRSSKEVVEGLNLESYMEKDEDDDGGDINVDGETKPLDGIYPKSSEKEQIQLRRKLGYSESAETFTPNSNVLTGSGTKETSSSVAQLSTASPVRGGLAFDLDRVEAEHAQSLRGKQQAALGDHHHKQAPPDRAGADVDNEISQLYAKISDSHSLQSGPSSGSSKVNPVAKESAAKSAARVDALLMELFPERMEKDKKKASKAAAGVAKKGGKQSYGMGVVGGGGGKAHDIAHYLNAASNNHQASRYSSTEDAAAAGVSPMHISTGGGNGIGGAGGGSSGDAVLASVESQMRLLRRELKGKDDKLARVTEHSLMLAAHMDRLKGEVAFLTMKLKEAEMALEAKEARLGEALKLRKRAAAKKASNSGADVAALESENARLVEREQALMDAVEELSVQNQDLIAKLKQSMSRELELSSRRAALISSTVAAGASSSSYHLPNISKQHSTSGDGTEYYRAQSEPADSSAVSGPRGRASKKKKASSSNR